MATEGLPTFSALVPQKFLVEPLNGPQDVFYYLERFPEEVYNKSPDSHLYKFMRAMLGDSGVNWIRKNYFDARQSIEEMGVDMFDLDSFFGSPFEFGRIVEETFDDDPTGLIPRDEWEQIKAKNARYRNRSLDYLNGARGGNTPHGMRLVAKAGLGHDVEIVENYKYLFDIHSDDPIGLQYYGRTTSTGEMIVLPRREIGQSEVQRVSISGEPNMPNRGGFKLIYNGLTTGGYTYVDLAGSHVLTSIPYNGTSDHMRLALETILGTDNVVVTGGPGPNTPWNVSFTGILSDNDVPELQVLPDTDLGYYTDPTNVLTLVAGNTITVDVDTLVGGVESVDEVANIPPKDQYYLQQALDRIRSQTTIPTVADAQGTRSRTNWNSSTPSSQYSEVVRYVTGSPSIRWPTSKDYFWIVSEQEKEAPRVNDDLQFHYSGFHNISVIEASSAFLTDTGQIDPAQALADYAEPLFVTSATETDGLAASFVNGIYPVEYKDLPGVPPIRYTTSHFWTSLARTDDEWLIIRFPFVQCVNYLSFDIERNPLNLAVEYDSRDQGDANWVGVTKVEPYSDQIMSPLDQTANMWASLGLTFTKSNGCLIWTRALRINMTRQQSYTGSVSVRNLRAGRNIG